MPLLHYLLPSLFNQAFPILPIHFSLQLRRRQTSSDMNGKKDDQNKLRSSSAEETRRVPRSTSTSDLKNGEDDRQSRLVEDRIEKIVREELRAARDGTGSGESGETTKKKRRDRRSAQRDKEMERSSEESTDEKNATLERIRRSSKSSDKSSNAVKKEKKEERISEEEAEESKKKERSDDSGKENRIVVRGESTGSSKKRGNSRFTSMEDEDIYEDEWDELSDERPTGKDVQRRYIHEKAIFQELTHLKRMQIQYGKVQERILVHSLVHNFCRMHGLNPSDYKFSSFYAWEKFLYEQLKSIYVEEREKLTQSASQPKLHYTNRLNKFETKLKQARAVPLNDRIRELTRIYASASITGGKKPHKLFGGQKRCDCLGRHLLVKND